MNRNTTARPPDGAQSTAGGPPRAGRRSLWLRRAAVALPLSVLGFLFGVVPVFVAVFIGRATTRPMDRDLTETPKDRGAAYEDVVFDTADGVRLRGWYLPSRGRNTTIVFAHGLFRSRREPLDRAMDLWREGFGALLYDARNHGGSGPARVTLGYNERLDVEAAARHARARRPGDRIAALGISMGAAAAILAAAEAPEIDAVIADSSYLSLRETTTHHLRLLHLPAFPLAEEIRGLLSWRGGFADADLDLEAAVRGLRKPALFIAAAHDRRMPPEIARRLVDASPSPERKVLVIEGPESDIHAHAYQSDPKRYVAEVSAFLGSFPQPHP
jgi:pimeloyl-ACP methyl ester carboxylesterase